MRRRPIVMILVLAVFWGCASPESSGPPPVDAGRPPGEPATARPGSAPAGPVVLSEDDALRFADLFHPDLELARRAIEASEGRSEQGGLLPNPTAVARWESAHTRGKTFGESEVVAGIQVPIPFSGRLSAAQKAEDLERERLQAEAQVKKTEVHRRVRGAFAAALYFQRVRKAEGDIAKNAESVVAATKARIAAGDGLPEELARAEMEAARAALEVERAESFVREALSDLVGAIAAPGLEVAEVSGTLETTLEIPAIETLVARLAEHPEAITARAEVAARSARLDLALVQRIPDLSLEVYYRRLQHSDRDSLDVGLALPLPIFDRKQGRIREARAELLAADAELRDKVVDLERQLRSAHARLGRALGTARTLRDRIVPRAELVLKSAEARYKAGDMTLGDVLLVRRDRAAVELGYLEALRETMSAWSDLLPFVEKPRS